MAEVSVVMTPQEAKLWRAQQKIIAQTQAMEGGYKKVGRAGKQAGDAATKAGTEADKAFGKRAMASVTAYVGGMATLTVGINAASQAMQFFSMETDKAKASFDGLLESRRALSQIATSAGDLQSMEDRADTLAREEGVDRSTVREALFAGRSEGFADFVPKLVEAEGANVITVEAGATAAGQVPGLFTKEDTTPSEAVNAILFAAQQSRLNFEQLSRALPSAAEGAAQQGASTAETIAITSVLASRFKSGEAASDRIKAFAGRMAIDQELGISGLGIVEGVEKLQALPDEQRRKFLGESAELNSAYTAITEELEVIKQRVIGTAAAMAKAGTPDSEINRAIARNTDETTKIGRANLAAQKAKKAALDREIANEQRLAEFGNDRAAAIDRGIAQLKQEGVPEVAQFGAETVAGAVSQVPSVSPEAVERVSLVAGRFAIPDNLVEAAQRAFFPATVIQFVRESIEARRDIPTPTEATVLENRADGPTPRDVLHVVSPAAALVDNVIERVTDRERVEVRESDKTTEVVAPTEPQREKVAPPQPVDVQVRQTFPPVPDDIKNINVSQVYQTPAGEPISGRVAYQQKLTERIERTTESREVVRQAQPQPAPAVNVQAPAPAIPEVMVAPQVAPPAPAVNTIERELQQDTNNTERTERIIDRQTNNNSQRIIERNQQMPPDNRGAAALIRAADKLSSAAAALASTGALQQPRPARRFLSTPHMTNAQRAQAAAPA